VSAPPDFGTSETSISELLKNQKKGKGKGLSKKGKGKGKEQAGTPHTRAHRTPRAETRGLAGSDEMQSSTT